MTEAKEELEGQVTGFNAAVDELWEKVEEAHGKLQEAIEEADAFRQEIADVLEEYAGERSERWEEGDSGQEYIAWKDQWADCDLETPELDKPNELEMPEDDAFAFIENFEQLPPAPGY